MAAKPRSRPERTSGSETASVPVDRPFLVPKETIAEAHRNAATNDVSGGGFVMKPLPYTVTIPPPDDYYVVRVDQLDKLGKGDDDNSLAIFLAAGGVAVGLLPSFFSTIGPLLEKKPVGLLDLVLAGLTIIFAVLATTKYFQYRTHKNTKDDLKNKIKSGQKAKVTSE